MRKNLTQVERFDMQHSYEQITDMETQFLLDLYDAIVTLVNNGDKVSLPRIAQIVKVRPAELMDYIHEITEMERQLNVDATE